jgi:SAM-dependent methyltransferase
MPRDWNSAYLKEDTPWDKGYAAPPLAEFVSRFRVKGKVLVPGCGAGHDVRLLAKGGAEVLGLDVAPGAVKKAQDFPVVGSEKYELGNFLHLAEQHTGAYDWLVEHTLLCALDPVERSAYAESARAVLKPGGRFLAVFYRKVADYDGQGPPHPISGAEIDALFGEHFETLESFIPQRTYPSRPVRSEEVRLMRLRSGALSPDYPRGSPV